MQTFTQRAVANIQAIPPGRVMTYGQIAALSGQRRGARQVVRILHSMSKKHGLPWHRVLNAKGEIGLRDDESFMRQKLSLEAEGVTVDAAGRVDLRMFQYHPDEL